MKRIAILDGLRGVAAGMVVFHHWWIAYPRARGTALFEIGNFVSNLNYLAVLFFFCLSGFSIGIKYHRFESRQEVKSFLIKRLKRIVPIAYLSLLLSWLLCKGGFSLKNLLGNLLFLQTD